MYIIYYIIIKIIKRKAFKGVVLRVHSDLKNRKKKELQSAIEIYFNITL